MRPNPAGIARDLALKKGPEKVKMGIKPTKTEEKNVRKTHGYD
jgi:hypothetical protein